jgi:hypothetical protein
MLTLRTDKKLLNIKLKTPIGGNHANKKQYINHGWVYINH